jgi:hypothetical protein
VNRWIKILRNEGAARAGLYVMHTYTGDREYIKRIFYVLNYLKKIIYLACLRARASAVKATKVYQYCTYKSSARAFFTQTDLCRAPLVSIILFLFNTDRHMRVSTGLYKCMI